MTGGSIRNLRDRVDNFESLLDLCTNNTLLHNYLVGKYIPYIANQIYMTRDEDLVLYLDKTLNLLQEKFT
jgi:hypothetical protein